MLLNNAYIEEPDEVVQAAIVVILDADSRFPRCRGDDMSDMWAAMLWGVVRIHAVQI